MTCRYDKDAGQYLNGDGEPCRRDEYGDPTHHCTAPRCGNHIGRDELTCPRCIGQVRYSIRAILLRTPELLPEALIAGVNSEAANLAGPAADVEAWTWRKIAARQGKAWHASLLEDDDELHPYTVLSRWVLMLCEDYGHEAPTMPPGPIGVERAADYLLRNLPRVAQDPEQDFALMAGEIRKCRTHIETVIRDSQTPEKGAPCPDCKAEDRVVRMAREYPHWCDDPACERFHYSVVFDRESGEFVPDTTADTWVCPFGHKRSHEDYVRWVEDRKVGA